MTLDVLPLPVTFIFAFCVAAVINYPSVKDQKEIINKHAGNALSVAVMIFGAGIFTGILKGTHIMDAMGNSMIGVIPDNLGQYLTVITALISVPFTFFLTNDAFYFGVIPVVVSAGEQLNIAPELIARASLIGQVSHLLSPLVPSTYLLVTLVGVEFSDHLKFTIKWALGTAVVMLLSAILLGVI